MRNTFTLKFVIIFSILQIIVYPGGSPQANIIVHEGLFQKGMCYATWREEGFSSRKSDASLRSMRKTGVNCVQIVATWYQTEFDSTRMRPIKNRTPSNSSIRHVIRKAHSYGMSVMLKPHIDLNTREGNSRGDIGFSRQRDWEIWFKNYTTFITHYAKIAQQERVEIFCIGTELSYAAKQSAMWKSMVIPEVRKQFKGPITYAANWDNYMNILFWKDLDYAGIDAYFPLSYSKNPSLNELKDSWMKWLNEIEKWQKTVGKPVIFPEVGYCSASHAAKRPWEETINGKPNLAIQENCYRALFETVCEKKWLHGLYWWVWNTYAGSGGKKTLHTPPKTNLQ